MNFSPPTYDTETANLTLAPKINAALAHVATILGVSKSAYVESLLRAKFGIEEGVVGNFSREGLMRHLQKEGMSPPPELGNFRFNVAKKRDKRKPGRIARRVTLHEPGIIGPIGSGTAIAVGHSARATVKK